MIKYKYTLGNQTIECLNISEIPDGLSFETITFDEVTEVETPIIPASEIIIDLLTKQVEALTEDQKNLLLQNLLM